MTHNRVTLGGCLCGQVRFEIKGKIRDVVNCHCSMCQKLHGSFGAHTKAPKADITLTRDEGLAWYKSSDVARRGFCKNCGSSLFWEPFDYPDTGILAGSLDGPTGLKVMGHIFVGEKADFIEISDDYPQFDRSSDGQFTGDYR
ncbi:GFA family protein [Kordiimonas aestuarii]|uniref:GFA family protein n=1 Tax=Kordiimonas aestuarii TaxID=1005925 RepID=UPI0021D11D7C|nr:GFA family protein [Kordiimonas aestuarii]